MKSARETVRQLWARQQICGPDVDYGMWGRKRESLIGMSAVSRSCIFTVDVYKGVYDYASGTFTDIFGIGPGVLRNIEKEGDVIEDLIHPRDRDQLLDLQIGHGRFIYGLDPQRRNDFRTIYQWRMRSAGGRYINVTSRQQVLETDRNGKAWIIMGMMEVSPDQTPADGVKYSVLDLKTGLVTDPRVPSYEGLLTGREREVLSLMGLGRLSKEIASELGISINTVSNHRKNILSKLGACNAVEAVNAARKAGIID